jgi:hypothetical protein
MADPVDPPAPVDPPTPVVPPAPAPVADPPAETPVETVVRLEAEVAKLRKENGNDRVNAKKTAADEARVEMAQTVGKALGIITDGPIDPAVLTEQITAAKAEANQSAVELAVYRASEAAGGDPVALLDSRTFLANVADIDPSDTAALAAVITAAVGENPRLGKEVPLPQGMRPNPAQGRSASPPADIRQQIATAETAGDVRQSMLLKAAQLVTPK